MKKATVLILILVLLLGITPIALAEEGENLIITPERSSVFLVYEAFIDETSSSIIAGTSSELSYPTKQSIYMELQKWNGSTWITVDSWSDSETTMSLDLRETYPKSPGKYRVKGIHTADGETRTSYSGTKTID